MKNWTEFALLALLVVIFMAPLILERGAAFLNRNGNERKPEEPASIEDGLNDSPTVL